MPVNKQTNKNKQAKHKQTNKQAKNKAKNTSPPQPPQLPPQPPPPPFFLFFFYDEEEEEEEAKITSEVETLKYTKVLLTGRFFLNNVIIKIFFQEYYG